MPDDPDEVHAAEVLEALQILEPRGEAVRGGAGEGEEGVKVNRIIREFPKLSGADLAKLHEAVQVETARRVCAIIAEQLEPVVKAFKHFAKTLHVEQSKEKVKQA
jgi:hypothetical protein